MAWGLVQFPTIIPYSDLTELPWHITAIMYYLIAILFRLMASLYKYCVCYGIIQFCLVPLLVFEKWTIEGHGLVYRGSNPWTEVQASETIKSTSHLWTLHYHKLSHQIERAPIASTSTTSQDCYRELHIG